MPVHPKTKFNEPSGLEGVWRVSHHAEFETTLSADDLQFALEKMTGILMKRQDDVYSADDTLMYHRRILTVRRHSFQVDFEGPRNWIEENKFLEEAARMFSYWKEQLPHLTSVPKEVGEDPAPLKAQVLEMVRRGKYFRRCHKEGCNTLLCRGGRFLRVDEGDFEGQVEYAGEEEFLTAVRNFFEWDARKDIWPHVPPESKIWRCAIDQMQG